MNVREQLTLLLQLGQKDLELKDLKDRQKNVPQKAHEAQVAYTEGSVKESALKIQIRELELSRHQLDLEIQTEKANLRKWEARADKIKGEREHMTLLSEIGSQKKAISDLENRAFEMLEKQEAARQNLENAQKTLLADKALYEKEWSEVEAEMAVIGSRLTEVLKERTDLIEPMPVILSKRYEQIAARRMGTGVALLVQEVCQACKRTIPPELCNRIAKGEVIETCPSCQRLLVAHV